MICLTLTAENFDENIDGDQPVLVDFWAPWCMPCKMLGPVMNSLSKHYQNKAKIGKINIDDHPSLAQRFGISSIPTVLVFHKNNQLAKFTGIQTESVYKKAIDDLLDT